MESPVHGLKAGAVDVGVDLRRGDVGVPEQELHHAQVGSAREQVGREAVPQHVRVDVPEACRPRHTLDDLPDRDSLERSARVGDDENVVAERRPAGTREQHRPRRAP